MLAVDTSTLVEFFNGTEGKDVNAFEASLHASKVYLPPIVLAEILSYPKLSKEVKSTLTSLPSLELIDGFWYRAGLLRSKVFQKKRKARLGDALIAQYCIDHKLTLITRDNDF